MKRFAFLVFVVALVYSCVTVNIYFPAQEVSKKASEIVKGVRGGSVKAKPQSFLFAIRKAYAGEVLTTTNATIRAIENRMRKRYVLLKSYFMEGYLGESINGFIVVRKYPVSLRERVELKRLVKADNRDRKKLYVEVARSLNIPLKDLPRVERIFAKKWQQTAPAGTYIQTPNGWVRKR